MAFTIDIQNEHSFPVEAARLQAAAQTVLNLHDIDPDSSLTVVIAQNERVQALNRQFRGVDAPTDVLSFPADAPPLDETADEPPYLGDMLIAFPYAAAQAEREGHNLGDSLALLVVHGTLHLLGYDHDTPENRADMWDAQEEALQKLNIPLAIVPALEEGKGHDDPA
jgi:probable rRNA maturation factor